MRRPCGSGPTLLLNPILEGERYRVCLYERLGLFKWNPSVDNMLMRDASQSFTKTPACGCQPLALVSHPRSTGLLCGYLPDSRTFIGLCIAALAECKIPRAQWINGTELRTLFSFVTRLPESSQQVFSKIFPSVSANWKLSPAFAARSSWRACLLTRLLAWLCGGTPLFVDHWDTSPYISAR